MSDTLLFENPVVMSLSEIQTKLYWGANSQEVRDFILTPSNDQIPDGYVLTVIEEIEPSLSEPPYAYRAHFNQVNIQ